MAMTGPVIQAGWHYLTMSSATRGARRLFPGLRNRTRLQTIPIVGAQVQEALLQQLRKDPEALVVGQIEESSGLRDGRRQAAHVAEFATHAFDELLIGRLVRRRAGDRPDSNPAEGNVQASVLEGEWLALGGRHDANAP